MKTSRLSFFVLLIATSLSAQNWSVFNPAYRYNYKYANSALVSHVIFADSVKLVGADSVFYLNRIGVECTGSCPTITATINATATVVVPNMPQFLQRKIRKLSTGTVVLKDTATLVLNPNAQVGQSWLFDSINNVNAMCISKTQQSVFGLSDSLKTILVGATDTIKISKLFGLIQFPDLYGKNKYYHLAGVEKSGVYDKNPFYGEKVHNAWDIYNFAIGDAFCYSRYTYYKHPNGLTLDYKGNYAITGKTITATGYIYSITDYQIDNSPKALGAVTTKTFNEMYSTSGSSLMANSMYPGQLVRSSYWTSPTNLYNLVKFGKDSNGSFYKYAGSGKPTYSYPNGFFPFSNSNTFIGLEAYSTRDYLDPNTFGAITEIFGEGIGKMHFTWLYAFFDVHYSIITCAVKNGSTYFGNVDFVDLPENHKQTHFIAVFPNPTQGLIKVRTENIHNKEIKITNLIGQDIKAEKIILSDESAEINLSATAPGIYYLSVFENSRLILTHKIIRQ